MLPFIVSNVQYLSWQASISPRLSQRLVTFLDLHRHTIMSEEHRHWAVQFSLNLPPPITLTWSHVASPIISTPSFQFLSIFSLLVSVRARSMMSTHNSWTWIRKTQELRLDNQLQTLKRQLRERPIEHWTLWAHRWICPSNCSNEGCVDMYTID